MVEVEDRGKAMRTKSGHPHTVVFRLSLTPRGFTISPIHFVEPALCTYAATKANREGGHY